MSTDHFIRIKFDSDKIIIIILFLFSIALTILHMEQNNELIQLKTKTTAQENLTKSLIYRVDDLENQYSDLESKMDKLESKYNY